MGTRPALAKRSPAELDAMLQAVPGVVSLGKPLPPLEVPAVDPDRRAAVRAAADARFAAGIANRVPGDLTAQVTQQRHALIAALEAVPGTVARVHDPDPSFDLLLSRSVFLTGWPFVHLDGKGRNSQFFAVDQWNLKQRKHLLLSGFGLFTNGLWDRTLFVVRRHAGAWEIPMCHDAFHLMVGYPLSLDASLDLCNQRNGPDRRGDYAVDFQTYPLGRRWE